MRRRLGIKWQVAMGGLHAPSVRVVGRFFTFFQNSLLFSLLSFSFRDGFDWGF